MKTAAVHNSHQLKGERLVPQSNGNREDSTREKSELGGKAQKWKNGEIETKKGMLWC